MIQKIKNYFQGVVTETRKITWPSRKDVINHTLTVVLVLVAAVILFGGIDFAFSKLLEKFIIWR